MKNKLPKQMVTVSLIDIDFVALELDINNHDVEVKWLRQIEANSAEYLRGLGLVFRVALELQAELRKTHALVEAYQ